MPKTSGSHVRLIAKLLARWFAIEQKTDAAGFTLVEVIAALAILSLSLVVLFSTLSDGFYNQQKAKSLSQATRLAQSLLAQVGTELPLRPGETSGNLGGHFRWTVQIVPFGTAADQREWPAAAYHVSIKVFANDRSEEPVLTLTTMRLGQKGAS